MLVLVAHADRWTRLLVSQVVAETGCHVVEASNGMSALRLAQRERPDLVLLGPALSEIDAQDVLGVLRSERQTRAMRVLMLRGSGGASEARGRCARHRCVRRRRRTARHTRRHVQAPTQLLQSV